jgi:hypothetical protein
LTWVLVSALFEGVVRPGGAFALDRVRLKPIRNTLGI